MSLRDMATASCAPDGAGASSLNPLSRLADAVLPAPLSGRPAPRLPSSSAAASSASASSAPPLSAEEAALLSAETPSGLDLLSHTPAAPPAASLAPPPLQAAAPVHSVQPPAPAVPLNFFTRPPPPLPPLPAPTPGAPTDLFERAFHDTTASAASPVAHLHYPDPHATAPASALGYPPAHPNMYAQPPPPPPYAAAQHPLRHAPHLPPPHFAAMAGPSWRTPEMLMSRLSLATPPQHQVAHPAATSAPAAEAVAAEASKTAVEQSNSTADVAAVAVPQAAAAVSPGEHADRETTSALGSTPSWGDEFTSFESAELGSVHHVPPALDEEDIEFDRGIDALYADWLAASAAETGYTFSVGASAREPGERAMDLLARAEAARGEGRLAAAVRLFEAALQPATRVNSGAPGGGSSTGEQGVISGGNDQLDRNEAARAWYLLGVTLAEADDDARAIRALEQGLSLYGGDARGEHPLLADSLVALAVSHTNEADGRLARAAMREWLSLRGSSSDGAAGRAGGEASNVEEDELVRGLHTLAAAQPDDVAAFTVLGIVHNVRRDYEQAAHMLRRAVQLRPGDATLWNKLGATLANGGNHDDALRAYRKAVDLRPLLIRAWVNVGTAYTNRGESEKAVRYYLKSIALAREQGGGVGDGGGRDEVEMGHVWGYLRSALISMRRGDLLELANDERLDALRSHLGL